MQKMYLLDFLLWEISFFEDTLLPPGLRCMEKVTFMHFFHGREKGGLFRVLVHKGEIFSRKLLQVVWCTWDAVAFLEVLFGAEGLLFQWKAATQVHTSWTPLLRKSRHGNSPDKQMVAWHNRCMHKPECWPFLGAKVTNNTKTIYGNCETFHLLVYHRHQGFSRR